MSKTILIVDEDGAMEGLEEALRRVGLSPHVLPRVEELDLWLTGAEAAGLLISAGTENAARAVQRVRRRAPALPVLFVGWARPSDPVCSPSDALAVGGDYFFKLPTDLDYLAGRVETWTQNAPEPASNPPSAPVGPSHWTLEAFSEAGRAPEESEPEAVKALREDASQDLHGRDDWSWVEQLSAAPEPLGIDEADATEGPTLSGRFAPDTWAEDASEPAVEPETESLEKKVPLPRGPGGAPGPEAVGADNPSKDSWQTNASGDLPKDPDSGARALLRDAESLLESGHPAEALEALDTAAALLAADGRIEAAFEAHRRAVGVDPAQSHHAERGADLALELGRTPEAIALLETAATALEHAHKRDEAREIWDRLSQLAPRRTAYADAAAGRFHPRALEGWTEPQRAPPSEGPAAEAPTEVPAPAPPPRRPPEGSAAGPFSELDSAIDAALLDPLPALEPDAAESTVAPPDAEPVETEAPETDRDAWSGPPMGEAPERSPPPASHGPSGARPGGSDRPPGASQSPPPATPPQPTPAAPGPARRIPASEPRGPASSAQHPYPGGALGGPGGAPPPNPPARRSSLQGSSALGSSPPGSSPPGSSPPASSPPGSSPPGSSPPASSPPASSPPGSSPPGSFPPGSFPPSSSPPGSSPPGSSPPGSSPPGSSPPGSSPPGSSAPAGTAAAPRWPESPGGAPRLSFEAERTPAHPGFGPEALGLPPIPVAERPAPPTQAPPTPAPQPEGPPGGRWTPPVESPAPGPEPIRGPALEPAPDSSPASLPHGTPLGQQGTASRSTQPDPSPASLPHGTPLGQQGTASRSTQPDPSPASLPHGTPLGQQGTASRSTQPDPSPASLPRGTPLGPQGTSRSTQRDPATSFDAWLRTAVDPVGWSTPDRPKAASRTGERPPIPPPAFETGWPRPASAGPGATGPRGDSVRPAPPPPASEAAGTPAPGPAVPAHPGAAAPGLGETGALSGLAPAAPEPPAPAGSPGPAAPERRRVMNLGQAVQLWNELQGRRWSGEMRWNATASLVWERGEVRTVRGPGPAAAAAERLSVPLPPGDDALRPALIAHRAPAEVDGVLTELCAEVVADWVNHRGDVWLQRLRPPLHPDESPPHLDPGERVVEALIEGVGLPGLVQAVGGADAGVRVSDAAPSPRRPRERLFRDHLDGRTVEAARQVAGIALDRAYAWAAYWGLSGHAEVQRAPTGPRARWGPASELPSSEAPGPIPETAPGAVSEPQPEAPARSVPAGHPIPQTPEAPAAYAVPHRSLAGLPADQRVRQLAHLARTADYFALLDLSPDASTEAVGRSAAFLGEVIRSAMQTQAPGVRALAEEVVRVVEEARHVLSAPDLRAAYQKHLTRRG